MNNFNINHIDKKDLAKFPSDIDCQIFCLEIKVNDFKPIVEEFKNHITDTIWIKDLDQISQIVFENNTKKTIDHVVNSIIAKVTDDITVDIGEYLVSYCSQQALHIEFEHELIPLTETLKEKISNNPGFDFHTISNNNHLIFGEAKFSLTETPRARSLDQIVDFIDDRDNGELLWLQPFFLEKEEVKNKIIKNEKGYAASFSHNNQNIHTTMDNALESESANEIFNHKELYLIAVEIC